MIGWYVHHHGRGHLTRARAVAAHVAEPVVGLSTLPDPGGPFAGWVQLPPDDGVADPRDPTARGVLHWAPHDPAIADRVAALVGWVARERPRRVVVDVSVEATLAVRLAGVPVVVVAMPGDRTDPAHATAYTVAERVLAFWPREVYAPSWAPATTTYLGAVSRFDGRPRGPVTGGVVVLRGAGGGAPVDLPPSWRVLDGGCDDPWPLLCAADVVVTHGGQNALAEVAAARRPAVVVAEERPFGEQRASAAALDAAGIAVRVDGWSAAAAAVGRAAALGGDGWVRWSPGDAAARAAAEIAAAGRAWAAA